MQVMEDDGQFVTVQFTWSKEHGECYDCGLPAAYAIREMYGPGTEAALLCSVCAAYNAAMGNGIPERLVTDDD